MRFSVIEIGSNSVKCNIYEWREALSLLLSQARTLGLIRYVSQSVMQEEGICALLDTIDGFCRTADMIGCERTYCVATASLRGLENGQDIISRIAARGCTVRILSGEEEALFGFRAAVACADLSGKGILVDLGGASTELTAFENGERKHFVSLNMGCLSLYRMFVSHVFPDQTEQDAIKAEVHRLLASLPWRKEYGERLFLIGGTARLIGHLIARDCGTVFENGMTFSADALDACLRTYRIPEKEQINILLSEAPDRLHTVLPGMLTYGVLAKEAGTKTFTLTFASVREGLALSLLERKTESKDSRMGEKDEEGI